SSVSPQYWSIIILVADILLALLPAMFLFDGVVEFEYDWHRDAWESDDRPRGYMFFRAPEAEWLGLNTHFLFFAWLFTTPAWARGSKSCVRSLRWMRFLLFAWAVGLFFAFRVLRQTV